jgi:hypothetical protein
MLGSVGTTFAQPFAKVTLSPGAVNVSSNSTFDILTLRISGDNFEFDKSAPGAEIFATLMQMQLVADGIYNYEIVGVTYTGETFVSVDEGRAPDATGRKSSIQKQSGQFKVSNFSIVVPAQ